MFFFLCSRCVCSCLVKNPRRLGLYLPAETMLLKADFIRRAPSQNAFKAALKRTCQASCHMACTCFPGQVGVQGAEGAPGEGVMFSIISRASAALQASRTRQCRATEQKGIEEMLFYWTNYSEARRRKNVFGFTNQIMLIQEIKLPEEIYFWISMSGI